MFDQGGETMQVLHRYPKIKQEYQNDTDNEEEASVPAAGIVATVDRRPASVDSAAVARRPTKRSRREEPLFPLNLPMGYEPFDEFTLDTLKYCSMYIHDCSKENAASWPTFRNGLFKDEVDRGSCTAVCICFGDAEIDEKLDIESSYCIGILCCRMNYDDGDDEWDYAYKFLKAGSMNDLGASTRNRQKYSGRVDMGQKYSGRVDMGCVDEMKLNELWNKARVDLGKYHEE